MSQAKTAYVPRFGSQPGPSQTEEPQLDTTMGPPKSGHKVDKCRNKRERGGKPRFILKVKLPEFSSNRLSKKKVTQEDETPGGWTSKPAENRTSVTTRGSQDADVGGVFFSKRSTNKATNKKKEAKLAVLKTTARMMEENKLIRQRLAALTKAHTDAVLK
ncbi:unnamed protein product [Pleuronectes platessa]|uniref:Uncharacterized protein n=1 Tax=Pleuronectes platessa TaxID=8262 RepID=A0A9N7U9F6_PLEPL|nr:unnamed protein product [Pleuronectes platessa]